MFYLKVCPYCIKAEQAIKELTAENPDYGKIKIERIEEAMHPEIAREYDYWYVPTLFVGKEKAYEARPGHSYEEIRANIKRVFDSD